MNAARPANSLESPTAILSQPSTQSTARANQKTSSAARAAHLPTDNQPRLESQIGKTSGPNVARTMSAMTTSMVPTKNKPLRSVEPDSTGSRGAMTTSFGRGGTGTTLGGSNGSNPGTAATMGSRIQKIAATSRPGISNPTTMEIIAPEPGSEAIPRVACDPLCTVIINQGGRDVEVNTINESGLFSLILISRKPDARFDRREIS